MDTLEPGTIERVVGAFGAPLLEFLCSVPVDEISNSPQAAELVTELDKTLRLQVEGEENIPGMAAFLRARIAEVVDGEVLGYTLYRQVGGDTDLPEQSDPIEDLIMRLAAQCLPILLLPPDDFEKSSPVPRVNWNVISALHRHPLHTEFQAAVQADAKVGKGVQPPLGDEWIYHWHDLPQHRTRIWASIVGTIRACTERGVAKPQPSPNRTQPQGAGY